MWFVAPLCLMLGACSTAPIAVNYAPSSTMTVSGHEKVGTFKYLPAEQGKAKPNQIRNTAIGNILFDKDISDYFKDALFDESRFVGIKMGEGPEISGTINDFLVDDLGWSVDWTLDVTYEVRKADGSTCYTGDKVLKKHTAKFANAFGTLNDVMKLNIEKLFSDPAFVQCIAG
jgi:uncharacterized lipoprotein